MFIYNFCCCLLTHQYHVRHCICKACVRCSHSHVGHKEGEQGDQNRSACTYLTVLIAAKAWSATPTICDRAVEFCTSTCLVCCLYRAAETAVATMTKPRTGPSLQDNTNRTRTEPVASSMALRPRSLDTLPKTKLRTLLSSTDRREVSSEVVCLSKNSTFCSSSVRNSSRRRAARTCKDNKSCVLNQD